MEVLLLRVVRVVVVVVEVLREQEHLVKEIVVGLHQVLLVLAVVVQVVQEMVLLPQAVLWVVRVV
jgi:hypothetical protein